jgi:hypothetical protein
MFDHSQSHWEQAKRVLRNLEGTADSVLMYGDAPQFKPEGWSDSDGASDVGRQSSRTGYMIMLNGSTLSWISQRLKFVPLSTAEAAYMALIEATQDVMVSKQSLPDVH